MPIDEPLEDQARHLLDIFVKHYECRPDYLLNERTVEIMWEVGNHEPASFEAALQRATEQGWIEIFPGPKLYLKLTQSGYDTARK